MRTYPAGEKIGHLAYARILTACYKMMYGPAMASKG
jgi:hypothetical protein